jgi:hypothetical protein
MSFVTARFATIWYLMLLRPTDPKVTIGILTLRSQPEYGPKVTTDLTDTMSQPDN